MIKTLKIACAADEICGVLQLHSTGAFVVFVQAVKPREELQDLNGDFSPANKQQPTLVLPPTKAIPAIIAEEWKGIKERVLAFQAHSSVLLLTCKAPGRPFYILKLDKTLLLGF